MSDARGRLVGAACELMWARGYGAIGVAEICARADVRKGSFYHFFESKQALTVAVIDARWAKDEPMWRYILEGPGTPLARLENLVESQAGWQREASLALGAVPGCLFGTLASELGRDDEAARARLTEVFAAQRAYLDTVLAEAEAAGEIPAGASAGAVLAQIEGQVLFAKLADDPAVLDDLWGAVRRLLRP